MSLQRDVSIKPFESIIQSILRTKKKKTGFLFCAILHTQITDKLRHKSTRISKVFDAETASVRPVIDFKFSVRLLQG